MDAYFMHLGDAVAGVLAPSMLLFILAGVIAGIILGALPGFGSAQSLAVLFPLTFVMGTEEAILFLLAVYSAAEYGGSIPAILIRTPGTPAQSVTILDGYEMTRKGLATRALRISLISGVIGGIASTIIFFFSGTSLALVGLKFGPGEMFALGVFGLSIIGGFFGRNVTKGFVATGIGLILATVGSSGFGGVRFAFEQPYLVDGFPIVVIVIGLLAGPEAFRLLADHRHTVEHSELHPEAQGEDASRNRLTRADYRHLLPTWVRSTLIGTVVGIIPGAGGAVAAVVGYSEEKRWSKRGNEFGTGLDEALAAPETANNAVVAGTLVPTLALGIPGSGAAAILMGVLISKGVAPGPIMFQTETLFILTIFLGLIAANLIMLVVGLAGSRTVAVVGRIPRRIIGPFVLLMLLVGTYAYATYMAHVVLVTAFAAFAYLLAKIDIPAVPMVLAFVMGPIIEQNLSRALVIHGSDAMTVMTRPITLTILGLSLLTIIYGIVRRKHQVESEPTESGG